MMSTDTNHIPIVVSTSSLSRKNSSSSHTTVGTLSRKNSSNSYASVGSLSRKNSSNSYASVGSLSRKNSCNSLLSKQGKRKGPGVQQSPTSTIPFPWKLHRILDDADTKGFNDIISWVPSENGFKVHKTKQFDEDVMPKYFDKTKYKSFQRQLNMWGFDRVGSGPYKGAYLHSCFIRGQPHLCEQMQRTKIKGIHSKKLRKKSDLLGGSSHSLSNHSTHSVSSISSSPSVSDIEIHASIKRAAEKVADLEQQKEKIQRKLRLLSTQTNPSNITSQTSLPLPEDDAFQPLPLNEGDSLLFGGRNFFFAEDGKFSDRSSNQQRRRAGRRYSLELKGPDSDQYILKELQGDCLNLQSSQLSNFGGDMMSPTPLGPDELDVVKATTNISNCNSSLIIGLDKPTRRFSFLSTPVHNPFEKINQRPPRPPISSNSRRGSDMNSISNDMNMMNMDSMTSNMMNMQMNMKTLNENQNFFNTSNGLGNLLRMTSQPTMNTA